MKKILLLSCALLSLGATQATEEITLCKGDAVMLNTHSYGDSYQWYKDDNKIPGEISRMYIEEDVTNDAIYTCEIVYKTQETSANLVNLGNFEFENSVQNRRTSQEIYDNIREERYMIEYQFDQLNPNDEAHPGEYCTSTNPNNIQPQYFTSISAREGERMLVVNGTNSGSDLRIFEVRNLKLKGGVTYQFSCWAANIDKEYYSQNHGIASLPKIKFEIEADGYGIQTLGGGYITISDQLSMWKEYKVSFTPAHDCNWAHIRITNTSKSDYSGNDFVIDNVYFGAENTTTLVEVERFEVKTKDCSTPITETFAEENITVSEGQIICPDAEMVIYNTSGLNVTALNGSLQPGVYVVYLNGNTTKVMVK